MKLLRYLAIALGGVLVLLVALGAYVALTFDAERVKGELARVVQEKKQRTLRIDGAADLSFWPGIGVKLERVSLSERGSDQVFASLDAVRVSLQLLPLLRKHIVIDAVELTGARATVVRRKDGSTNIDDLLAREEEPSPALRFDIGGVKLERAHLAYRDEQTGQSLALSDLDVDTGRLGLAAAGKLRVSTRFALAQPRSTGELKLAGSYRYDLEGGDITVSDLDAKLSGDLAGMKGVDAAATAERLQLQRASGAIAADKLALSLKGKRQAEAFELKLDAPGLALAGDQAQGEVVKVTAKLSGGARTVDARLDLSGVSGSRDALAIAKLALVLDAKFGDRTIKGGLSSPVTANLRARTVELPKYSGEFDIVDPNMPVKNVKLPLSGSLRGDLARGTAAGTLSARFDESQIQAKFDVTRFDPLAFAFDVDIDKLNADRYRAARSMPSAAPGAAPARGNAKAEEPIDLSALKKLDARGTLRIGQLQVADVKASNVRMEIRSAGGRLEAAPHSANLYNGKLSGALALNANNNSLALRQTLSNVSINPLMKDALDKDLLEGRGNVSLDVSAAGASTAALKKSLAGSASIHLQDGAIKGINLAQTLRSAKAALSGRQDVLARANQAEKTDFSELSASFRIAQGVARNDDLEVKSPFLRLGGTGEINVAAGSMNYLAKATVVGTSKGQGGRELEQLQGLTVPVRVSGPFDDLSYRIEFASLVGEAAKAKVEEKKQEVQRKAEEKLKEKLKGLLGR